MATITGYVKDQNGNPVVGASIYIVSAPVRMPDIAQLTDDQGKFILGAPTPGKYTIGIRSDELGAIQKEIEVINDPISFEIQFS